MIQSCLLGLAVAMCCVSEAQAIEQNCDHGACHSTFLVSQEEALCARLIVPANKDGSLGQLWMSGIEVEVASRLNGEECTEASFFAPYPKDADYLTPAIKSLHSGLRYHHELLKNDGIESQTLQCLLTSKNIHVSGGDKSDESDGGVTVTLAIEGCEYEHRLVEATLHTKNKVTMSGFNLTGGIGLTYKMPFVDVDK